MAFHVTATAIYSVDTLSTSKDRVLPTKEPHLENKFAAEFETGQKTSRLTVMSLKTKSSQRGEGRGEGKEKTAAASNQASATPATAGPVTSSSAMTSFSFANVADVRTASRPRSNSRGCAMSTPRACTTDTPTLQTPYVTAINFNHKELDVNLPFGKRKERRDCQNQTAKVLGGDTSPPNYSHLVGFGLRGDRFQPSPSGCSHIVAVSVVQRLRGEYQTLLRVVDDINPCFGLALIAGLVSKDTKKLGDLSDLLSSPIPGNKAEADGVVYQSIVAWRGATLKHDTSALPNFTPIVGKGMAKVGSGPKYCDCESDAHAEDLGSIRLPTVGIRIWLARLECGRWCSRFLEVYPSTLPSRI
ncbi:hypothetical protein V8F20_002328 [Naviculisporaceae sp. PSN 640]